MTKFSLLSCFGRQQEDDKDFLLPNDGDDNELKVVRAVNDINVKGVLNYLRNHPLEPDSKQHLNVQGMIREYVNDKERQCEETALSIDTCYQEAKQWLALNGKSHSTNEGFTSPSLT